jgi:hypothetical protein
MDENTLRGQSRIDVAGPTEDRSHPLTPGLQRDKATAPKFFTRRGG